MRPTPYQTQKVIVFLHELYDFRKVVEKLTSENSQTKIWNFAHLIVSLQPNGDVPVFGEGHKRESGASPEQYPLL
jgi:hypothetical protein